MLVRRISLTAGCCRLPGFSAVAVIWYPVYTPAFVCGSSGLICGEKVLFSNANATHWSCFCAFPYALEFTAILFFFWKMQKLSLKVH